MITVKRTVHMAREARGRRRISTRSKDAVPVPAGRVPRISHLMALAIRLEHLLNSGQISDVMELARLGHITQPRVSQILNLNHLAPDIQEELLFLPRVLEGRDPIHEKMLRPITAECDWKKQREIWARLAPA